MLKNIFSDDQEREEERETENAIEKMQIGIMEKHAASDVDAAAYEITNGFLMLMPWHKFCRE